MFNTSVPEHIKQVLGDLKTFQNFGLFFVDDKRMHRSLLFMNGARWKEHRSSISHHFTRYPRPLSIFNILLKRSIRFES